MDDKFIEYNNKKILEVFLFLIFMYMASSLSSFHFNPYRSFNSAFNNAFNNGLNGFNNGLNSFNNGFNSFNNFGYQLPKQCDSCLHDPLYNSPPLPPPADDPSFLNHKCSKFNCNKCSSDCAPSFPLPVPVPFELPKDPCPLKSFCDPGLANTCFSRPIIDPCGPRRSVTTWKINYLISNRPNQGSHLDPEVINPWGIVIYNNQLWVVNGSTDRITNYDLFGNRLLGSVTVRDAAHNSSFPTGIAINCGGGFIVSNGSISKSGLFVTATEHGTVHVYNPTVDALNTYLVLNKQLENEVAVFKGLAVANGILYLADFFHSHIDVFDSSYNRLNGYHFIDGDTSDPIPLLEDGYGPSNIVHIGCFLYVLWGRKDPNVPIHAIAGPGFGFISVFNLDGSFVRRFTSRGVLNNPWGMIPAPCECGFPPGSFLVSNHGDGRINVFDCAGRYVGPLLGQTGLPIFIDGLRGLAPHYTEFSEIYFTAATDEDIDGTVGSFIRDQIIQF